MRKFLATPSGLVTLFFVAGLLIGSVLGLNVYLAIALYPSQVGLFGDMFGFSNAVFGALALVGVACAVYLQREEVRLAKAEVSVAKADAKQSQKLFAEQDRKLQRQSFESTFFNLLTVYMHISDSIEVSSSLEIRVKGKDAISALVEEIYAHMEVSTPIDGYEIFIQRRRAILGHYFRILYNLFKFIDRADLRADEKSFFANIVRAQLSDDELVLLMFNACTIVGSKFKQIINAYKVLDNIPKEKALRTGLTQAFERSAFGNFDENQSPWSDVFGEPTA